MPAVPISRKTFQRVESDQPEGFPPPPLPAHWTPRPRLHARLAEASHRKVTVVTGPPGCGKTWLVSGWVRSECAGRTNWLSGRSARPAETIPQLIRDPDASNLVVVDDIHLISDLSTAAQVEERINELPAGWKAILIGRHRGALSLARLGLVAEVSEIRQNELEFTFEEAANLIACSMEGTVDSETIEQLLRLTQGWAVGLRLAAVLLSQRCDPRAVALELDAVGGPLWDYLEREVLGPLSWEDAEFLALTSVARRVSPEFCEAVTGRADSRRVLDSLASRQLLVQDIGQDGLYVYHPALRGHLGRRLARQGEPSIVEAHRRAADWLTQAGCDDAAKHHYILAHRADLALGLEVAQVVRQLVTGPVSRTHLLLPDQIPERYFEADPLRMYALCASLLCASRLDDAACWLTRLQVGLDSSVEGLHNRARAEWLWAIHDSAALDAEGVLAHSEASAHFLDKAGPEEANRLRPDWLPALDNAVTSAVRWMVAKAHADMGRPVYAMRTLDEHRQPNLEPRGVLALGPLSSVALAGGHLREAVTLARRALETAGEGALSSVLKIESLVALAGALFEQDEVLEARQRLAEARKLARETALLRWVALVDCEFARLSLSDGNPGESLRQLEAVWERSSVERLPGSVLLRASTLEFRCYLSLGEVEHARFTLDQIPAAARPPDSLVRIHLCAGRPDKAAAELDHLAPSGGGVRDRIERMLLRARISLQTGNPKVAEQCLEQAIDLARPERFFRVFMEEPRQVIDVMLAMTIRPKGVYHQELLSRLAALAGARSPEPLGMLEPLTERERELIAFLPSHLTQHEIGRRMYISANTVKTHMKGLYRKLGASSRSEAVELAKSCGLL